MENGTLSLSGATKPWLHGYTLIELLFVLAVLGICLFAGAGYALQALVTHEARGAAQTWQAGAAWAQIGALWHGGSVRLAYGPGSLLLSHSLGLCGRGGTRTPSAAVTTNLTRWRDRDGVAVEFGGAFGSPDGGGSLFFEAIGGRFRVVVRPESGLTKRTRVVPAP